MIQDIILLIFAIIFGIILTYILNKYSKQIVYKTHKKPNHLLY